VSQLLLAFIVKQGGTPYYNSAVTIDGSSVLQNGKVDQLHQQVMQTH
jgi:hypothetical protein